MAKTPDHTIGGGISKSRPDKSRPEEGGMPCLVAALTLIVTVIFGTGLP